MFLPNDFPVIRAASVFATYHTSSATHRIAVQMRLPHHCKTKQLQTCCKCAQTPVRHLQDGLYGGRIPAYYIIQALAKVQP